MIFPLPSPWGSFAVSSRSSRIVATAIAPWIWLYSAIPSRVLGLLLVMGLTLHHLGAIGSMLAAMGINLLVAITCGVIDRFQSPLPLSQPPAAAAQPKVHAQPLDSVTLALAVVSGAGIIAAEIIALDAIQLVATMSFYAPAVVLATVLGMLAVSALIVPRIADRSVDSAMMWCLIGAGLALALSPLLFMRIAQHWNPFASPLSVLTFGFALVGLTLVLLGPGLFIAAFVFPLLMRRCGRAGDEWGRELGWLLALNGLGGFPGAEIAYRLILPNFGPHQGMGWVGLLYVCVALVAGLTLHGDARRLEPLWCLLPGIAACIIVGLLITLLKTLPVVNPKAGFQLVDLKFGREGNLAVVDHPRMGRAMLAYNQYILGSTAARYDQERQAHIPLLVHPKPSQIAFIGIATGMTPGAALLHPDVETIHAVELSSLVANAADQYFRPYNHGVTQAPRAQIIIEDGRTWIAASQARYDVIIGDLFLPWRAGVGRLYSLEHFGAVRRALREGGVFCQWLPMFQMAPDHVEVIAKTLQQVFPRLYLFRNSLFPDRPAMALIGFKDGDLDWEIVRQRTQDTQQHNLVRDPSLRHAEGLSMLYLGTYPALTSTSLPVNTLGNLWVERYAGRARITAKASETYLYGQRWHVFIQRRLAELRQLSPARWQPTPYVKLGLLMTNWEMARRQQHPVADRLASQIRQAFPVSMATDPKADWTQWPGTGAWKRR